MTLPDKDHPLWKIAQSVVALGALIWLGSHGLKLENLDADGVVSGLGGLGLAGKLAYQFLKA